MKTYMAKNGEVAKKWYVVDAEGKTFGRLASQVAAILIGKNKPEYTPNVDCGDYVIVINTDKLIFTGKKLDAKMYHKHSGYVGSMRTISYRELMRTKSDFAFTEGVRRMLPKTILGNNMIKKLHCYKGAEHNNQAQMPEKIEL